MANTTNKHFDFQNSKSISVQCQIFSNIWQLVYIKSYEEYLIVS